MSIGSEELRRRDSEEHAQLAEEQIAPAGSWCDCPTSYEVKERDSDY